MNSLIVRGADGTQRQYALRSGVLTIGRDPANDIHLDDAQVSWRHARLIADAEGYCIEDLSSTNGTFVSTQRIERRTLQPQDRVLVGPYELALSIAGPSPDSSSERTLFAVEPHTSKNASRRPFDGAASNPSTARNKVRDAPAPARWQARLSRLLPALEWVKGRHSWNVRQELVAGAAVAAMMVPQGIAYATLAGLPPIMGLHAAILPMIAYALAGSGRQTSVGPVSLDSVIVAVGLGALAAPGSMSYVALAVLLALLIGAIQLGMSMARLGFLVNFLSYPVLAGFTAAAALIIAVGQIQHLFGISQPSYSTFHEVLLQTLAHASHADVPTSLLGVGGVIVLLTMRRRFSAAVGPLSVMIACTVLAYAFDLDKAGVSVVGEIPAGAPGFNLPEMHAADIRRLLPLALTLALVGFAQTISIGKSLGNKYGYDVDADRELGALGFANLCSSVTQGYPVSGSLSRSAANAEVGARTPLAAVFAAVCVGLTAMFLTPLFHYLPHAALAAIIIVSSLSLIDLREIRYLFKVKLSEGILLAFAFAATLICGITLGLLFGVVASILLFITLNTRPNTAILGRLPRTNIFRNIENFSEAETVPGLVILRIDASLYFANTVFLKEKIHEIFRTHGAGLKAVILDASAVNDLDSSADTALHQLCAEFKKRRVTFYIAGVKAPVREVMKRSGLYEALGGDRFFFTIDAAVKRFQEKNGG